MITPSNFYADPLGWAGNQAGHMAICMVASYWMAVIYWHLAAEYPYRWQIALIVAVTYLAIELPQRGEMWDTIEDILFVAGYGVAVFIWPFREIEEGQRILHFDPFALLPAAALITAHFAIGVAVRAWQLNWGQQ